jgi:hypothetical protein
LALWVIFSSSSCWAFATASVIDGAYQIQKNVKIETSQQDLIDCSGYLGTKGCNGGSQANGTFWFIKIKIKRQKSFKFFFLNSFRVYYT